MTRQKLESATAVLLGGQAADLAKVTNFARCGMKEGLSYASYESDKPSFLGRTAPSFLERHYREATAEKMDVAARHLIQDVFAQSLSIREENRAV